LAIDCNWPVAGRPIGRARRYVLFIEQVDRLSRLSDADWQKLRAELDSRQIRVVALDLPTSWQLAAPGDEFTARMFAALNA
jgi:DNA invertase Pin-like site-specific DNA recombinase